MRGATVSSFISCRRAKISIHAPHARSDTHWNIIGNFLIISIHAPHARSDSRIPVIISAGDKFQSTLLMRGATYNESYCLPKHYYFNPRSSCEERLPSSSQSGLMILFQSTLLMRGATWTRFGLAIRLYFNPRSSCEERHKRPDGSFTWDSISIHAPHARSDVKSPPLDKSIPKFQSTLLMRGATVSLSSIDLLDFIIHFSRTQHLFPKTLLLTLCPVSSISCVMALRA